MVSLNEFEAEFIVAKNSWKRFGFDELDRDFVVKM